MRGHGALNLSEYGPVPPALFGALSKLPVQVVGQLDDTAQNGFAPAECLVYGQVFHAIIRCWFGHLVLLTKDPIHMPEIPAIITTPKLVIFAP